MSELMYIVRHMYSFTSLMEMKSNQRTAPPFIIKLTNIDHLEPMPGAVSSWSISFKNCYSKSLFITILNLNPLHGVAQMFPNDEGNGKAVKSGDCEEVPIGIFIPETLERLRGTSSSGVVKDIFKIFVTTHHVNLRHYGLKDLTSGSMSGGRHGHSGKSPVVIGPLETYWVHHEEIATPFLF
jgi:hypothetical protein